MNFPETLVYTKDHEWVRVEGDIAYVGITDFAQKELGDIVYVDINTVGKSVAQHDDFGTVEAVKPYLICSCLFQRSLEMNGKLDSAPELVNAILMETLDGESENEQCQRSCFIDECC